VSRNELYLTRRNTDYGCGGGHGLRDHRPGSDNGVLGERERMIRASVDYHSPAANVDTSSEAHPAGDVGPRRERGVVIEYGIMRNSTSGVDLYMAAQPDVDSQDRPGTDHGSSADLDAVRELDARMHECGRMEAGTIHEFGEALSVCGSADRDYVVGVGELVHGGVAAHHRRSAYHAPMTFGIVIDERDNLVEAGARFHEPYELTSECASAVYDESPHRLQSGRGSSEYSDPVAPRTTTSTGESA
jgi:hypothetical protein